MTLPQNPLEPLNGNEIRGTIRRVDSVPGRDKRESEKERRRYHRYSVQLFLNFWYSEENDKWQTCIISDFSLEGLQMETLVDLQLDSTVLLDFSPFSSHAVESPLITGHIIWKNKIQGGQYSYGIFFMVSEKEFDGILEEHDRDRDVLVDVLSNLIESGKARLRKN
jgi:hypothetical protein